MIKTEIYISTDVETDGPIPGSFSMLSFASAAFKADKTLLASFSANLQQLPDAKTDPNTMEFWRDNPKAWTYCRENPESPAVVMLAYRDWLINLPGTPIFVAYPLAYDFMFIYWYLIKFTGESPFLYHGIDIRSYAMAILKSSYKEAAKKYMPKYWFDDYPHTHKALDDAIEQGALFCNILAESKSV